MQSLLLLVIFIVSCTAKKPVIAQSSKNSSVKFEVVIEPAKKKEPVKKKTSREKKPTHSNPKIAYIERYKEVAMEEMRRYKIPASITLAQGMVESGSGQSNLVRRSNNHFGIKCHKGWTGGRTYHDDDKKGECFRVYKHPEKSYRDHSLFLAERSRYAALFDLKITDYKGWAKGLRKAGYATDKNYPKKLIAVIEAHELYRYDSEVLGKKVKGKRKTTTTNTDGIYFSNSKKRHVVEKGDTLYSISKRYGLSVDQLKAMNRLRGNEISIGQELKVSK